MKNKHNCFDKATIEPYKKIPRLVVNIDFTDSIQTILRLTHQKIVKIKGALFVLALSLILFILLRSFWNIAIKALNASIEKPEAVTDITLSSIAIEKLGTFGDFFGGISNPVIGAVGFIAITITIAMQVKQNKESIKQNFESSFFNLLSLQNNIIENLEFRGSKSRSSFSKFLVTNEAIFYPKSTYSPKPIIKKSMAHVFYKNHNADNNDIFGHYFRNMYRILKMIHDSRYTEEEKRRHARTLRAQLSMDELAVLFLNCLPGVCDDGRFCNLLIKYQMLEHLSVQRFGREPISPRNYKYSEFIIGGKIRVSYKEIDSYLKDQSAYYYNHSSHGAFGKNTSFDLANLKRFLISRDRKR